MMNLHGRVIIKYIVFYVLSVLFFSLTFDYAFCSEQSEIIDLAKIRYTGKLKAYQSRISYCKGLSNANIITKENKKILNDLGLEKEQLKKAILTIHAIILNECDYKQFGEFLIYRGKYKETLTKFKIKDDNLREDFELFTSSEFYYKLQVEYLKLPFTIREKIENIEQLKKPFYFSLSSTFK